VHELMQIIRVVTDSKQKFMHKKQQLLPFETTYCKVNFSNLFT